MPPRWILPAGAEGVPQGGGRCQRGRVVTYGNPRDVTTGGFLPRWGGPRGLGVPGGPVMTRRFEGSQEVRGTPKGLDETRGSGGGLGVWRSSRSFQGSPASR